MTESPVKTCHAAPIDALMVCDRCGQEWRLGAGVRPACDPITFETLINRARSDELQAEVSLKMVRDIKAEGGLADPALGLRRLAETSALRRLVERCATDPQIKARLNGK